MHERMKRKEEREKEEKKEQEKEERKTEKMQKKMTKLERDKRIDELQSKKKQQTDEFNAPIGTSLLTSLFNGIQMNVKHVHIRYEDDLFSKTRPYSLGFMIDEIDFGNADSHWVFHTPNGMRFSRQSNK